MISTHLSKTSCRYILLCGVLVALTGCSNWQMPSLKMPEADQGRASGQPQSIMPQEMQSSSWGNPDAPVVAQSYSTNGDEARMASKQKTMTPKMKTAKVSSMDLRVMDLEKEVAMLRQDMDRLLPALQRLIAGQEDVAMIVSDMNRRGGVSAKPVKHAGHTKAMHKSASQLKKITPTPVVESGVPKVTYKGSARLANIRTGEHANKTRLVLDVGSDTPYSYDLDNNEKLLVIELGQAPLTKAMQASLAKSQFVSSYKAESTQAGSRVIVLLKRPAKIMNADTLKASAGRGARILFDIGPA